MKTEASIIIPAYNQAESINSILAALDTQNIDKKRFEVIVADDGSEDAVSAMQDAPLAKAHGYAIRVIHQRNSGRAVARNKGAQAASGRVLIFCDGDRIPRPDFVQRHLLCHDADNTIVTGASFDFYGKRDITQSLPYDWDRIMRLSRLPAFYKKSTAIYSNDGYTNSQLAWLSFLVGNASISNELFFQCGQFDENIKTWGFEHYDLAYRCQKMNAVFRYQSQAISFHIPHARKQDFYHQMITQSCAFLQRKYPELDMERISSIFFTNTTLQEIEEQIS